MGFSFLFELVASGDISFYNGTVSLWRDRIRVCEPTQLCTSPKSQCERICGLLWRVECDGYLISTPLWPSGMASFLCCPPSKETSWTWLAKCPGSIPGGGIFYFFFFILASSFFRRSRICPETSNTLITFAKRVCYYAPAWEKCINRRPQALRQ